MAAMALAGCSGGPSDAEIQALVDEAVASAKAELQEEQTPAPSEEPSEEPSAEPSEQPAATKAPAASGAPESYLTAQETTAEKPAQVGEWVETMQYSTVDSVDHPAYYRIVGVERGAAAQAAVDQYNSEDHFSYFGELEDPDLEYCLLTYEVYYPEDFPAQEWGVTGPSISLGAKSPDGGGIKYNGRAYIGLGMGYDVTDSEVEVFPGEIFEGKAVFAMVKDFKDYVFENYYFVEDAKGETEQISSYVVGL